MPQLGRRYDDAKRVTPRSPDSEKNIVEGFVTEKRSAPSRRHGFMSIFSCCFSQDKFYTEHASTPTVQPRVTRSTVTPRKHATRADRHGVSAPVPNFSRTGAALMKVDPQHSDFIYEVLLHANDGTKLARLMVLDFRTDVNVMSDQVFRAFTGTRGGYTPCGTTIWVDGMGEVKPLGSVVVKWTSSANSTVYTTEFYVVNGCQFDLLLGRPSVVQHQLARRDPAIGPRIRSSYQDS